MPTRRKDLLESIFESLRSGIVPRSGCELFATGLQDEQREIERQLDYVARGHGTFKFIRGPYGSGKTFLTHLIMDWAHQRNFITANVVVDPANTQLYRFDRVYHQFMTSLAVKGHNNAVLQALLTRWLTQTEDELESLGVDPDSDTFDDRAQERHQSHILALAAKYEGHEIAPVLNAYYQERRSGRYDRATSIVNWLSGAPTSEASLESMTGSHEPMDSQTARTFLQMMASMARIVKYSGMVFIVDELETILRMPDDERIKSLDALRDLIDRTTSIPGSLWIFTGTPEFFDSPKGVAGLPPLHQRIGRLKASGTHSTTPVTQPSVQSIQQIQPVAPPAIQPATVIEQPPAIHPDITIASPIVIPEPTPVPPPNAPAPTPEQTQTTNPKPTILPLRQTALRPLKHLQPDPQLIHAIIGRLTSALEGHKILLEEPITHADVEHGPRLLRAFVRVGDGQSINSVRNRSADIARSVGTSTNDIAITNVPERRAIALDLPISDMAYTIDFSELAAHPSFLSAQHELTLGFCAGINILGHPMWVDLATMPHMLVAGTTGSGKTVFLRSIILTLVMQHSDEHLHLMMSSSKPMDFQLFTKLPHARHRSLAETPSSALYLVQDLVEEMDRRIALISRAEHDNLKEYNADPNTTEKFPFLVAILDEFSEMMLSFSDKSQRDEFETAVSRLAQKARAAGIHLILCMQRPDVKALTGSIKSNILHRFALKLPQQHDSRVILDENGAETLLGHGDLLYKDDSSKLHRLQVPNLESSYLRLVIKHLSHKTSQTFSTPVEP